MTAPVCPCAGCACVHAAPPVAPLSAPVLRVLAAAREVAAATAVLGGPLLSQDTYDAVQRSRAADAELAAAVDALSSEGER